MLQLITPLYICLALGDIKLPFLIDQDETMFNTVRTRYLTVSEANRARR